MVHLQKKVAMEPQSTMGSGAEVQAKENELIQVVVSRMDTLGNSDVHIYTTGCEDLILNIYFSLQIIVT